MSKLILEIPLIAIQRIQIYINKSKKALTSIKAETGADYILNGGLFNSDWTACCHLKADGIILSSDPYTYFGYGWNNADDFAMGSIPCSRKNYICCSTLIDPYGPVKKLIYTPEQGGERRRTALGMKGDNLCLYCTNEGHTPEKLQTELATLGWDSAVMLDGGTSSQCDFAGQTITSERVVHNLILVYLKKEKQKGNDTVSNVTGRLVKNFSIEEMTNNAANEQFNLVLTPSVVEHAQMMQELRDWAGRSLSVNSWYRTVEYNKKCGGASNSEHLDGCATDISNIKASEYHDFCVAWAAICASHGKIGNLQLYSWGMHFGSHADKFGWTSTRVTDNRK